MIGLVVSAHPWHHNWTGTDFAEEYFFLKRTIFSLGNCKVKRKIAADF